MESEKGGLSLEETKFYVGLALKEYLHDYEREVSFSN